MTLELAASQLLGVSIVFALSLSVAHLVFFDCCIVFSLSLRAVTTLLFQCFPCALLPAPTAPADSASATTYARYLVADGQSRCYEGAHLTTLIVASMLLLFYSIGLPLGSFILLARAFLGDETTGVLGWLRRRFSILRDSHTRVFPRNTQVTPAVEMKTESDAPVELGDSPASPSRGGWLSRNASTSLQELDGAAASEEAEAEGAEEEEIVLSSAELAYLAGLRRRRENLVGFLYLSFRPSCCFGSILLLLASGAIAAIDVFLPGTGSLLRFFCFGLVWSAQLLLISLYLPFDSLSLNVRNVAVGFATLAHAAVFLGVQQGGVSSGYMVCLLVIFAALCFLLLYREKIASWAPWLRVVRRADLKLEEKEIVAAAERFEKQMEGDGLYTVTDEDAPTHTHTPSGNRRAPRRRQRSNRREEQEPPTVELTAEGKQWQVNMGTAAAAAASSSSPKAAALSSPSAPSPSNDSSSTLPSAPFAAAGAGKNSSSAGSAGTVARQGKPSRDRLRATASAVRRAAAAMSSLTIPTPSSFPSAALGGVSSSSGSIASPSRPPSPGVNVGVGAGGLPSRVSSSSSTANRLPVRLPRLLAPVSLAAVKDAKSLPPLIEAPLAAPLQLQEQKEQPPAAAAAAAATATATSHAHYEINRA